MFNKEQTLILYLVTSLLPLIWHENQLEFKTVQTLQLVKLLFLLLYVIRVLYSLQCPLQKLQFQKAGKMIKNDDNVGMDLKASPF